jgi:sulfur carrier protein
MVYEIPYLRDFFVFESEVVLLQKYTSMKISVNAKGQQIEGDSINLLKLLQQNNVQQPDMVSVQVNENFVNREDFESTIIKDGDEVDFLFFMGGGQW